MMLLAELLAAQRLCRSQLKDDWAYPHPGMLLCWLRTLGFSPVTITIGEVLMFTARKPARAPLGGGDGCTT
jgi:hypothetical protein